MGEPGLTLYGHPFSSYTWKALIALYANETPFEFRMVDADHPDHVAAVQSASPQGKFPLLADGENLIFEASSIIEYLSSHHPGPHQLIPLDPHAANIVRMYDRVFDNYVMNAMQPVVGEYIRNPEAPDQARITEARTRLRRSYALARRLAGILPRLRRDHPDRMRRRSRAVLCRLGRGDRRGIPWPQSLARALAKPAAGGALR